MELSDETRREAHALLLAGKNIEVIRMIQQEQGCMLSEAKGYVDQMCASYDYRSHRRKVRRGEILEGGT